MASFYAAETPERVKKAQLTLTKGLHLITSLTPNGRKVHILLEELKDTYGLEWMISLIDLDKNEQKKDWFLRLNPNGRIPILIDNNTCPPHVVMKSSAELLYLVNLADKDNIFWFLDLIDKCNIIFLGIMRTKALTAASENCCRCTTYLKSVFQGDMVAAHGSIWLGRVRANTALLISMPGPGCEIFDALDSRRMSWLRYLIYNSGWIALRRDQLWSEVWGSGMMRMCIQSYCLRLRDYLLRCA
ncbi:putative glutathione S-transferase [Aspergillus fumigatus]